VDILVDSNVILDILTEDPSWLTWSADNLAKLADTNVLVINPIIYSEVYIRFDRIEELDDTLDPMMFRRDPIPWEAAFLAGKVFLKYRRAGGNRTSPLPDFFIGSHASVSAMPLVTRDPTRYRQYFPKLRLIAP
jgi:hypothetical protein